MMAGLELWAVAALITALLIAAFQLLSQYFKLQALPYLFWARCCAVILTFPVLFLLPIPQSPKYYIYTLLSSVIFAYVDLFSIGLAAKIGAGVVSRLTPLGVIVTFVLWTAITPSLFNEYLSTPIQSIGIMAAISLGVYFTMRLKKCDVSWSTLKIMSTPILLAGLAIVFSKTAMNNAGNLHSGVFYYPFIQGIVVVGCYGTLLRIPALRQRIPTFDLEGDLFDRKTITAGLISGVVLVVATVAKYYGISLAVNPAYVSMLALTAPLWVLLIYRIIGYKDEGDIWSGLGIVAAAMMLIYFTSL